ncbi:dermonecrotic toxin domain-containing protein [Pseudomonas sp. NPDC087615]|uniref:dermonecrotic toxin domain-containing protein n=1 Tax=Pseudomonas sp. NPDC087615 TaxID=3364443 RepID=UPI00381577C7
MHLTQGQHPTAATDPQHPDDHYQHLKNALPDWLANVSPARRMALKNTRPSQTLTLQAVPTEQHQILKALNAEHWTAQSEVDTQLEHLQDASAFAEPLLKQALKSRLDLDVDVRKTFLRLYIPATTPWFPISTGARTWTVSLLDAALHNFEEKETRDGAFEADSTYITQPSTTGQFDTLPSIKAKLSIADFTKLCRELDIGAQYKTHLEDHLGFSDPAVATSLRQKIDASEKAAMRAALQMALMNRDISQSSFRLIDAMLDGLQGIRINSVPVVRHDVTMMGAALTGIVVFAPGLEEARKTAKVVAYVPEDPEHPFKEYASALDMVIELTRQLRSEEYQHFFSRFVNHEHRGFFFSGLNDRLSKIKWHPSVTGSAEPAWRESPVERPNLETAFIPFHDDLWQHLYQAKLNKILNDARFIAVPTASVDQKARWAFWDSVVNIISTIVQTAALVIAPFVPVLGEAMMAYMAYQFLNEAFEGIIEWAQGRTTEAFEHLMSTLESLIQLGLFAVGGNIAVAELPKILPKEVVAFIDRFKAVKTANEQIRYWDPDLGRYQQESVPAPDSTPNQLGLHQHQGKHLLPLENAHFAVSESTIPGQYRIEHPTRPDAYQPLLRHNGDGAWHTELEQPLEWDKPTALRRIGPLVESFSPLERETILQVSGVNEGALRKMHVDQEKLPPLLADSIQRFKIDQQLQRFNDYLGSDVPEQYLRADPVMQLQLLTEQGRWPAGKRLRLLDKQGELIWQSSSDESLPLTELHQDSLIGGDLLKSLFYALDEAQGKALLGMEFAGPTPPLDVRSQMLRKQLAQLAIQQRSVMFETRYQALQHSNDPLTQVLLQHDPALPATVTRELLDTASGDELLLISEGQVPARQQQLMQLASQEVRVTRAYEGLELDGVNNPDTDTLALHSLKRLPGWSGDVHIEIRDGRYEGPMLDSTGRSDAPAQKVLVRQSDGRYQPYDDRGQELHSATDFYSSILYALPDAERNAVNIQVGQAETLKAAIRQRPVARSDLRVAICDPLIQPPAVDTLRLVGIRNEPPLPTTRDREAPDFFELGEAGVVSIENQDNFPNLGARFLTQEERLQAIFRGYSAEEARTFTARFQHDPAGLNAELSRLRIEYNSLSDDLLSWENNVALNDPASGLPLTDLQRRAARQNRAQIKLALLRCWRRQTRASAGYILQIAQPVMGELPRLNADFSHVTMLSINGSASTSNLATFMQNFPRLMYMDGQNLNMPNLPQAFTSMPMLRQLVLRNCGITLSAANQSVLAAIPELSLLDLRGNPLQHPLDVSTMPSLRHLNLVDTNISALPTGLLEHPRLITGRFDNNQITEIPDAFFNLASVLSDGFSFADNPVSAATREQVKSFYNRTGRHFGIRAEQADILRTTTLYPALDADQATDLLYRLPGSLAQGRVQLAHWEAEVTQLNAELGQWVNQTPVTDQGLNMNEQARELSARINFAQTLDQFWRSRSALTRNDNLVATLQFMGDMPVLSANFDHVSRLTLTGNTNITALLPFVQRFQNLSMLELNTFDLEPVALSAFNMPRLTTLDLNNCGVILTPENQATLVSLNNLQTLDLRNNPLGTFPDLNLLPELTYADLSNTGISAVPDGLADHPNLRTAIFNGNLISELPEAIFDLPVDRSELFDFSDNPLSTETRNRIKTYYRKTGYDFDVRVDSSEIAIARDLFPTLDEQEASDVVYDLPGTLADGRIQLDRWRAQLTRMNADLTRWAPQVPSVHPVTGEAFSAIELFDQYAARSEFGHRLERLWRSRSNESAMREDFFELDLRFIGDMPRLEMDFSHVSSLQLNGNDAISGVGPFIELFTKAHILTMRHFALGEIPSFMANLPELKELTLSRCGVTLTLEGENTLAGLSDLELLNLNGNPLTVAPDLRTLPALNDLRLSNTAISTLPNGLVDHPNLRSALLNGNNLTDLPEAFFNMDLDLVDGVNLASNPLSQAARERIKTYYTEKGRDFGVLPDVDDLARAQNLFPQLDVEDASHMIYHLPGTLQAGSTQLVNWEIEMAQMISDLGAWAERAPVRDPLTGQYWGAAQRAIEHNARKQFGKTLEQFWRSRHIDKPQLRLNALVADMNFAGELPVLAADFGHVTQLSLQGNAALNIPDGFLACFTGVQALEIRGFTLGRLPTALTRMPSLESMRLNSCGISIEAGGQVTLSALTRLKTLDLYNNLLGAVPDLTALRELTILDLSRTGIDSVPVGLAQLPQLRSALLIENSIVELPHDFPGNAGTRVQLTANPLSAASRERIKTFFQTSYYEMGVAADQADIDLAQTIHPNLNSTEASRMIYRLPGTLADGRLELMRRQTELDSVLSKLEGWVNEAAAQTGLDAEATAVEKAKRAQFRESLEQRLRNYPTASMFADFTCDLSFTGELPALSGNFGYIHKLQLTSTAKVAHRVDQLIGLFPALKDLTIQDYPLGDLPAAIFKQNELENLSLHNCQVVLTPQTVDALGTLDKLRSLDLHNNPLGLTPDLRTLQESRSLDLSNTGLTEIPQGLSELPYLMHANLSDNAITELPAQLLTSGSGLKATFDFSGNPLTAQSQQRLSVYKAANEARLIEEQRRTRNLHQLLNDFEDSSFSNGSEHSPISVDSSGP